MKSGKPGLCRAFYIKELEDLLSWSHTFIAIQPTSHTPYALNPELSYFGRKRSSSFLISSALSFSTICSAGGFSVCFPSRVVDAL